MARLARVAHLAGLACLACVAFCVSLTSLEAFARSTQGLAHSAVEQEAPEAPGDTTLLGVVDEAGVLTPVVRFDGVRWRNRWPDPDEKLASLPLPSSLRTLPIAWTGVRPPAVWYIWPHDAALRDAGPRVPRSLRVSGPVRYAAHCMPGIGLQSDLRDSRPPTAANTFPKRKLAIALSRDDLPVERLDELSVSSAETQDLRRAAATYFRANVARAGEPAGLSFSPTGLRVRWQKIWAYSVPDSDERVYLLKGAASAARELGGFIWVRMKSGVAVEHRGRVVIDDDTYKSGTARVPMGVVSFGARRFWLSIVHGYESEDYELIEISSPRFPLALKMSVGGC